MMEATVAERRTTATVSAEVELLTVRQAAEALGVSVWTVYKLIDNGLAKSYVLGPHATVVDGNDVERLRREGWPDGRRKGQAKRS